MAGLKTGVPYALKKRERYTTRCETLGAEVLGQNGLLQPSRRKLSRIWALLHHVFGDRRGSFGKWWLTPNAWLPIAITLPWSYLCR
eukprot:134094-Amphidinium_carterae.1